MAGMAPSAAAPSCTFRFLLALLPLGALAPAVVSLAESFATAAATLAFVLLALVLGLPSVAVGCNLVSVPVVACSAAASSRAVARFRFLLSSAVGSGCDSGTALSLCLLFSFPRGGGMTELLSCTVFETAASSLPALFRAFLLIGCTSPPDC